jgi:hypothetical protein
MERLQWVAKCAYSPCAPASPSHHRQLIRIWLTHHPADPMEPQLTKERLGSIPLFHLTVPFAGVAPRAGRHDVANVMSSTLADRLDVLNLHVATITAIRAAVSKLIEPLAKRCH